MSPGTHFKGNQETLEFNIFQIQLCQENFLTLLSHFLEKAVFLAHRSKQKRKWIARSFGSEGNRNTRRCKGKGTESQNNGMSRKKIYEDALNIFLTQEEEDYIPFP